MSAVGPAEIDCAAAGLPDALRATPCVRSEWLTAVAGRPVWLKLESLQPTHSFKARGAWNALRTMEDSTPPLVAASAGNHGAAMAWACDRVGRPLTVFTPRGAPHAKRARIAGLGATLRDEASDYDDAERRARTFAMATGARFVSPYNDPDVIAGAGTVGREVLAQVPGVDEIVVPLGGGGLAAGVALALADRPAPPRVLAVEPAVSPAFSTALSAGRIVPIAVGETIADGLAGNLEAGSITFDILRELAGPVVEVTTASEPAVRRSVVEALLEEHLVMEGAAATAIAAVCARGRTPGRTCTVVVVSGANIDPRRLVQLLDEAGHP